MKYYYKYESPLGKMIMISDGDFLEELAFEGEKYSSPVENGDYTEKNLDVFRSTSKWLDVYFCGQNPGFTPEINPRGSNFRKAVWKLLLKIPYGETSTYKKIAEEIIHINNIKSMSYQAVGGAVAHNPISIIIPCHRVVGTSGNLTGYAGDIDKKISLLKLEKVNMDNFFHNK